MIELSEYAARRRRVMERTEGIAALLVSAPSNVRYLSGFTGSNGVLILTPSAALLLTDPRYRIQAAQETDCKVNVPKGSLVSFAGQFAAKKRWRKLGFEKHRLSFLAYTALCQACGKTVEPVPVADLIERERMVKSPAEVSLIRASVLLNAKAFERTLKRIKPSMTEADLAAEVDYQMRRLGAEASAFESIVAAGPRSALPHARPTSEPIGTDRLLLLDTGAIREGYCSDMTRVVHLGPVKRKARTLYKAVLEAQLAAIDAVRPGVKAAMVDRAARAVLRKHGLAKAFVHSTGHGLGLEIHEAPRLGKTDATPLEPGMAITIEPGAYLEGFGGVRIEDTVVVTATGCEILTPVSKELLAI